MNTRSRNQTAHSVRTFDLWSKVDDSSWRFEWAFKKNDAAFDGHFPQKALLPGVFLMEMAEQAALFALEQSGSPGLHLCRIERFRFAKPITPDEKCSLTLQLPSQRHAISGLVRIAAVFDSAGSRVANGTLVLNLADDHEHI
jgi:3-hydroxyacyl-[acyl-carrier-protein] dehydratase